MIQTNNAYTHTKIVCTYIMTTNSSKFIGSNFVRCVMRIPVHCIFLFFQISCCLFIWVTIYSKGIYRDDCFGRLEQKKMEKGLNKGPCECIFGNPRTKGMIFGHKFYLYPGKKKETKQQLKKKISHAKTRIKSKPLVSNVTPVERR